MYKFQPILKSLIWGGEKIAPYKGIATDQRNIGESWELSGVKDNESVVAEGPEAGTSLPELIARHRYNCNRSTSFLYNLPVVY